MKIIGLCGSAAFLASAVVAFFAGELLLAASLISAATLCLLLPGRWRAEPHEPLPYKKRTQADVAELRAFRKAHPDMSLIEAVRAVDERT